MASLQFQVFAVFAHPEGYIYPLMAYQPFGANKDFAYKLSIFC